MAASVRLQSGSVDLDTRSSMLVRVLAALAALVLAALAAGLYRQAGWATAFWSLPGERMDYIFLSGIVVAIAIPLAWVAWRNEPGALRALGMTLGFGATSLGVYLLALGRERDDRELLLGGAGYVVAGIVMALIWLWARRLPLGDARPLPLLVRAGIAAIVLPLVAVGVPLTFQVEDVFPWRLAPESSTMFGLIFLSAALLFGWIALHPKRAYGEMALAAFLGYTLVLAVPYIDLLRARDDAATMADYYGGFTRTAAADAINMESLVVYLAVLGFGSVLALWLFIQRMVDERA